MRRDGRRRRGLQLRLVRLEELVVGVVRVLLHLLAQVVRHAGRDEVHPDGDEVIKNRHVLREESIREPVKHKVHMGKQLENKKRNSPFVPAHALHDQKVVELVHGLREVHLEVVRASPEPERLVQVQHGEE